MLKILGLLGGFVVCSCEEVLVVEHSVEVEVTPIKPTVTNTVTPMPFKKSESMAKFLESEAGKKAVEDLEVKELESDTSEGSK